MALASTTVWEIQSGGSDAAAGGGFNASRTGAGTDYSLQTSPQYSPTDLAASSASTTLTSAAGGFTAAMVGNLIRITAGTNVAAGHYEITAYTNSTTVTLDRTPTSGGALSGGTGYVGGCLASPGYAASVMVGGNDVWIKAGVYSVTSTTNNVAGGRITTNANSSQDPARWIGYTTTRGDGGQATIRAGGAVASITLISTSAGSHLENLIADGNSQTSIAGFGANAVLYNCKALNCTNTGLNISGYAYRCEATACSGSNGAFNLSSGALLIGCTAHDNTTIGFRFTSSVQLARCAAWGNTGATTDGFQAIGVNYLLLDCLAYGNGRHGFANTAGSLAREGLLLNCLAVNNSGYGFSASVTGTGVRLWQCAAYNNTSGTFPASTFLETTGFLTLTADPFTAAGSQNFALNTTSGGGAALRAAGGPTTWPGASASMINYPDVGAAQHADPGATTTVLGNWIGLV